MVNNGWHNKIINHDVTKTFPLDDNCIDVVVTSPPYWGLRDYGVDGQIGLEDHPQMYIDKMVGVCREIRRVLKKSGSFYLNLGDTYFGGGTGQSTHGGNFDKVFSGSYNAIQLKNQIKPDKGWLQPKQLMLIPMRVAIALQEDGWILRNDIIWHKPNPMPSSVKDRLNNTFEHVFHFVKSRKYYYNLDSIREPHKTKDIISKTKQIAYLGKMKKDSESLNSPRARMARDGYDAEKHFFNPSGKNPGDIIEQPYAVQLRDKQFIEYRNLPDLKHFSNWLNTWRKQKKLTIDKIESDMDSQAPHHWFNGESYPSVDDWKLFKELYDPPIDYDEQLLTEFTKPSDKINNPNGKNPGDFWDICTQPFTSYNAELEHFAVFPEELIIKPIKASCPKGGVVLDPFCGRGTVGKVARSLGFNYVLFDIKPEYCELARLYVNGQKRKLIKYQNKLEFKEN